MQSLMSPRLLNEFNKLFEPPTFKGFKSRSTKPMVKPSLSPRPTYVPYLDPPSLSSSPASSLSSLSTSLDDEYIKNIWTRPSTGTNDKLHLIYSAQSLAVKDSLNPKATPFVPSFGSTSPNVSHVRGLSNSSGSSYCISELDFEVNIPMLTSPTPLYPPGLPHPSAHVQAPRPTPTFTTTPHPVAALPNSYNALLLSAIKSSTANPAERDALVESIVLGFDNWDLAALKELVEKLCAAAFVVAGESIEDQASLGVQASLEVEDVAVKEEGGEKEEEKLEENLASLIQTLDRLFLLKHGELVSSRFLWNVREIFLQRFILCFDQTTPDCLASYTTTHSVPPSALYIRCAMTLTKSIAALFVNGVIGTDHVQMCLNILVKAVSKPSAESSSGGALGGLGGGEGKGGAAAAALLACEEEYVEALASLVLGCGKQFWTPKSGSRRNKKRLEVRVDKFVEDLSGPAGSPSLDGDTSTLSDNASDSGKEDDEKSAGVGKRLGELCEVVKKWRDELMVQMKSPALAKA